MSNLALYVWGEEAFQLGKEDELLVLVPGEEVLLREISLPPLKGKRLKQALPYAFEEELLSEPEALHFAHGPYLAGEKVAVACWHKQSHAHWLKDLEAKHLVAQAIIPLTLALPFHPEQWTVLIYEGKAEVRTGLYSGFSTELKNLETLIAMKQAEIGIKPIQRFEAKNMAELKAWLLPGIEQRAMLNLLETNSDYQKTLIKDPNHQQAFRRAGLLLSLWLAVLVFSPLISYLSLKMQIAYYKAEAQQIYKHYYPKLIEGKDPSRQLQGNYEAESKASGQGYFLNAMTALAKASASLRMESIHYQDQQLILSLQAPSFAYLDRFYTALQEQGFAVKQQSARLEEQHIEAVLILTRKGYEA